MTRTPSQIGRLAKQRGEGFEREIGHALFDELGITFVRELEQVRTAGLSDLIPDDEKFPFALELKRRRSGVGIPKGAWQQSTEASDVDAGIYPAVIYRYDNRKARCVVPYSAIVEGELGAKTKNINDKADISFPRFCKLSREIMAWRSIDDQ
jgi:Holliday junction resolvase